MNLEEFREINSLVKTSFWRKNDGVYLKILIAASLCGKMKNLLTEKIFRQINYVFSNFFSKTVTFTKFVAKV